MANPPTSCNKALVLATGEEAHAAAQLKAHSAPRSIIGV